ncbi:MAG: hypothetical protein K2I96_17425 [Lachnospiraceae bacterium]|nr:hypothetical protein [Lachnospiraceae bacterium]
MDNLTATALSSMIHEQFERWNEQKDVMNRLKKGLLEGCTDEDSSEEVYSKMIINSMEIAANISAKIIMEILFTTGIMEPVEEEKLRKNVLSVIK